MLVGPIPDARNFQRGTAFHDISRPIPREGLRCRGKGPLPLPRYF